MFLFLLFFCLHVTEVFSTSFAAGRTRCPRLLEGSVGCGRCPGRCPGWPRAPEAAGQGGVPAPPPGSEPSADCGTHSWVAVSCLLLKDIPGRRGSVSPWSPRSRGARGRASPYLGDRSRAQPELSEQAGEVPQSPADLFTFLSTARQGLTSGGDPKGSSGTQGRRPAEGWEL